MMKIMRPIASTHLPSDDEQFIYEVKYDGFRCILKWTFDDIQLISRNHKDLTIQFPEIVRFCKAYTQAVSHLLPATLDGELVVLNHQFQANFSLLQTRGRLKTSDIIEKHATSRPAHMMVFDMLSMSGENYTKQHIK